MTARYSGSRTNRAAAFFGILAAITVLVSIAIRLLAAAWMILFWGIPLLIAAIIHIIVHIRAATRLATRPGSPAWLFVLSDLLCLLGFGLQPDAADGPGVYLGLYMVWNLVAHGGDPQSSAIDNPNWLDWYDVAFYASLVCLLGLVVTWVIILVQSRSPKKESVIEPA